MSTNKTKQKNTFQEIALNNQFFYNNNDDDDDKNETQTYKQCAAFRHSFF